MIGVIVTEAKKFHTNLCWCLLIYFVVQWTVLVCHRFTLTFVVLKILLATYDKNHKFFYMLDFWSSRMGVSCGSHEAIAHASCALLQSSTWICWFSSMCNPMAAIALSLTRKTFLSASVASSPTVIVPRACPKRPLPHRYHFISVFHVLQSVSFAIRVSAFISAVAMSNYVLPSTRASFF